METPNKSPKHSSPWADSKGMVFSQAPSLPSVSPLVTMTFQDGPPQTAVGTDVGKVRAGGISQNVTGIHIGEGENLSALDNFSKDEAFGVL